MENYQIETHFIPFNFDHSIRRIRILLPTNYENSTINYPVLYMHDGQNALIDEESYSKISWGIGEALHRTQLDDKWIVVMVDHAQDRRINDYCPFSVKPCFVHNGIAFEGNEGQYYADFLVNTIKPIIDETYRTNPKRSHTAMIGSSLGGLISAYIASKYQSVFSKIGVFSLASSFCEEEFLTFILGKPFKKSSTFYLQVGTNEALDGLKKEDTPKRSQVILNSTLNYYQALVTAGIDISDITLKIGIDEIHSESVWREYLPDFLKLISLNL